MLISHTHFYHPVCICWQLCVWVSQGVVCHYIPNPVCILSPCLCQLDSVPSLKLCPSVVIDSSRGPPPSHSRVHAFTHTEHTQHTHIQGFTHAFAWPHMRAHAHCDRPRFKLPEFSVFSNSVWNGFPSFVLSPVLQWCTFNGCLLSITFFGLALNCSSVVLKRCTRSSFRVNTSLFPQSLFVL